MKRKTGTITMFNDAKGVGFILMDEVEKEVIFYTAGLKEDVKENDKVIFDLTNSSRGLTAVNVAKTKTKKKV
jgi:cold shock protein